MWPYSLPEAKARAGCLQIRLPLKIQGPAKATKCCNLQYFVAKVGPSILRGSLITCIIRLPLRLRAL